MEIISNFLFFGSYLYYINEVDLRVLCLPEIVPMRCSDNLGKDNLFPQDRSTSFIFGPPLISLSLLLVI